MTEPTAAPLPEMVIREAILNAEALENWREAQRLGHEFDAVLTEAAHALREAAAALAQLHEEVEEGDALRGRLAKLLTDTANALKGPPAELSSHSWHDLPEIAAALAQSAAPSAIIKAATDRFLSWPLPRDFAPDCGISFDGRKDDEWNKDKTWPIGTNLFTADQAEAMFKHCLAALHEPTPTEQPAVPR